MSYFPARLFFKLPFFIVLYYLFSLCRPLFSHDEVDIINPGVNPSSLPRPAPCKLNPEDHPEWRDKHQMEDVESEVITPAMLKLIRGMGGDLPGMTGSPDMDDLFAEWFKKLSQKSDRKPGQPFNLTEANPDFKQPALLVFDPADEGRQVVLTIDEHGHLNASERADDKEEINASLEWEGPGAIWRNNKNELHMTSDEYAAEDFGDDASVLAYLDTIGTNHLYYRTLADGTRIYVYRALDGKVYEVTAEEIKRSQRITYEYEMAKVSGEGLAAGGRVNYEGELVPVRPAEPDRPEVNKGILDQEIEARQAPKGSKENKQDRGRPYPNTRSAKRDAARNEASVQKRGDRGATNNLQPSDVPGPQQSQPGVMEVQTDSTTLNHGCDDNGKLCERGFSTLKVSRDASFIAGIDRGLVVIFVPAQSENEERIIKPLDIQATSLSLSKDSLWMATTKDRGVTLWHRGDTVSQWKQCISFRMKETVKAIEFSPKGGYLAATLKSDNVQVINLRRRQQGFVFKPDEQFVFDEQEHFIIAAEKCGASGTLLKWMRISEENGKPEVQSIKWFDSEVQNLHLSPDTKTIVGLNENTLWVWSFKEEGIHKPEDHTSLFFRRINMSEDHTSTDYGRVSDVFFDDKSTVVIRFSEGCVQLLRTTRKDKDGYDFVQTYFEWPVNNDVKITNAFYIPDGNRIAVIFSDGFMRMRQYVAEKAGTQPLTDDSNFGEMLHYSGAKHCFLVRDSAGNITIRRWDKRLK